jgi:chaperone required for assembly of F1-ATPase
LINGKWLVKDLQNFMELALSSLFLEAMERATYTTKSFIIALALVKKHLTVEQASLAAQVEVASQIERWGEVEDSECLDPDVRARVCLRI